MNISPGKLLASAAILCGALLGWSIQGFFFGAAACFQAFALPFVLPSALFCGGLLSGCAASRLCKGNGAPFVLILLSALFVALIYRTMQFFALGMYSREQCAVFCVFIFAAGSLAGCSALLMRREGLFLQTAAAVLTGGMIRLAVNILPHLFPISKYTVASAVTVAVLAAVFIAAQKDSPAEKAMITAGTIAIATLILFVPVTGKNLQEKIFTYDGNRFIDYTPDGGYTAYMADGRISARAPADHMALPSLLPATLQNDNHNLQTVMSVSPASLLINWALQTPRIAALDHISGDPGFAAASQSNLLTTAEVNRYDRISQLRGPYDLAVVTEGDPKDFIPFLTSRGILAVSRSKAGMVPEDAFKYQAAVSGAEYFLLFSNAPLTVDWDILQKRYDNYDGKLKNFPAGIMKILYRVAPPYIPAPAGPALMQYIPAKKLIPPPFSILLLTAGAAAAALLIKISAGRRDRTAAILHNICCGILAAWGIMGTCCAVEEMAIPLFYQGSILFIPLSIILFFPSGAATSKCVYRLLSAAGCGLLLFSAGYPSMAMTGSVLLCASGCRPIDDILRPEAAYALRSAGAAAGFGAIWLITLHQQGIYMLLPLLLLAL